MEAGNTVTLQSLEGAVQTMTLDDYATRRRSRVSDEGDENTPPPSSKAEEPQGTEDGEEDHEGDGAEGSGTNKQRRRQSGDKLKDRRRGSLTNGQGGGEAVTRLLLPAGRIGGVIGRGGEVIKGIRENSGSRITIASAGTDDRDPAYRLVSVCGAMPAVCHAVDLIAQQATLYDQAGRNRRQQAAAQGEEGAAPASPTQDAGGLKLVIDSAAAGQLIGKRGATIQEIRSQSGARIQVISEEESGDEGGVADERIVFLSGDAHACRRAHQLIAAVLCADASSSVHGLHLSTGALGDATFRHQPYANNNHPSPSFGFPAGGRMGAPALGGAADFEDCQVIMRIPNEKIGRVIGKEGSTINHIRQESQCRIDIENSRSGEHALRVIRIRGNMQQTQVAQELIRQRMTAV